MTGTVASNHTIQGGYLNNADAPRTAGRPSRSRSTSSAVGTRTLPNWFAYGNYRGILRNDLLVEAQFSQRKFQFQDSGGSLTDIVNSPIITLSQTLGHYNAQYFDATDPENRNNQQLTGNLTYFRNTERAGRHEIKVGYEWFRSQRTGGNSQSATGYVFDADYATDAGGSPIFDTQGYLMPVFVPGETLIENWLPVRGAELNVDNNSIFAQDHVVINNRWSADLGFRFERVRSEATGGIVGVDTDTWVPRLATAYDVQGNGKHIFHVTYGWYAGRYNEAQVGNNNNVGNPNLLLGVYDGPAGQGRNFAPGFNPANYVTVLGQFPTQNVFFEDGLSSPTSKEFSASYGVDLLNGRGYLEGTYVHRDVGTHHRGLHRHRQRRHDRGGRRVRRRHLHEHRVPEHRCGVAPVRRLSVPGPLQHHQPVDAQRALHAATQQRRQLRRRGREHAGLPPGASATTRRSLRRRSTFPRGVWTISSATRRACGRFTTWAWAASATWRCQRSGVSTRALRIASSRWVRPITATQQNKLTAAGYPDAPDSQDIYFSERGANSFKGFQVADLAATYNIPVFRTLRPYFNVTVFNAFNNQTLIRWNTTVTPDANSPVDANGLRTNFVAGAIHGLANNNNQFPVPSIGGTGGRTWRFAAGFRF